MRALVLRSKARSAPLGFLLASSAFAAAAPASSLSLQWIGAGPESGCLGADGLERAVSASVSSQSLAQSGRRVVVQVERLASARWRAVVQVQDSTGNALGERSLASDGSACAELDEPLAFAVALMVDGEFLQGTTPENPTPAPAREKPERDVEAVRQQSAIERPHSAWALEAALVGASGLLPELTLGLQGGVEITPWSWLALQVRAISLLPRSRAVEDAEARFGLHFAELRACPTLEAGRLRYGPCLGLSAGVLTAKPDGFQSSEATTRRFLAGSAGLGALLRLHRGPALAGGVSALLPYERERFVYDIDGERRSLFEMSQLCLVAWAGARFEL
jgi:hypothetical protein